MRVFFFQVFTDRRWRWSQAASMAPQLAAPTLQLVAGVAYCSVLHRPVAARGLPEAGNTSGRAEPPCKGVPSQPLARRQLARPQQQQQQQQQLTPCAACAPSCATCAPSPSSPSSPSCACRWTCAARAAHPPPAAARRRQQQGLRPQQAGRCGAPRRAQLALPPPQASQRALAWGPQMPVPGVLPAQPGAGPLQVARARLAHLCRLCRPPTLTAPSQIRRYPGRSRQRGRGGAPAAAEAVRLWPQPRPLPRRR